MNRRSIRAVHDNETITVYQAFNNLIADAALRNQTFVSPPFKLERMTWIKPSFLWVMYRSDWATKNDQNRILEIKIKREGLGWVLANSCLAHFDVNVYESMDEWKLQLSISPVRIQWDPERDILLNPLTYRTIQIGLSGEAVNRYLSSWIYSISDATPKCNMISELVKTGRVDEASSFLPNETTYEVDHDLRARIGMI